MGSDIIELEKADHNKKEEVKLDTRKTSKPKLEKPSEKPVELNEGEKPKLKKVIKPKDKEVKNEDLKKEEESDNLPFKAKLRKTETVKRKIEEAKIETVQLKHHEF